MFDIKNVELREEEEILSSWGDNKEIVVSVLCATYNHERYIESAIRGFLMQKTSFGYEIVVRDDFSTDKTSEIIRKYEKKYPNIIKVIYESENQYSKGIKPSVVLLERSVGKYIAVCEGDDYWISPNKLQQQIDFLEKNKDYVLCWSRFKTLDEKTKKITLDNNSSYFSLGEGVDFNFEMFTKSWHIGMQTIVYCRDAFLKNNHCSNKHYRDIFLISDLLSFGKAYCLNEVTAMYRIHDGGIYSSTNELQRLKSGTSIYKEIYFKYTENKFLKIKFKRFNASYIKCLIRNKLYNDALLTLKDRTEALNKSNYHKDNFFINTKENLLRIMLYCRIILMKAINPRVK